MRALIVFVGAVLSIVPVHAQDADSTTLFQAPPTPEEFLRAVGSAPAVPTRGLTLGPAATRSLVFTGNAAPAAPAQARPAAASPAQRPVNQEPARRKTQSVAFPLTFAANSADLSDSARAYIDTVAKAMKLQPNLILMISGHTDISGNADANQTLSLRRAEAVRNYLVGQHGMAGDRFQVVGLAARRPLGGTSPADSVNRRVEFISVALGTEAGGGGK